MTKKTDELSDEPAPHFAAAILPRFQRGLIALAPGEAAPLILEDVPPGYRLETDAEFRARILANPSAGAAAVARGEFSTMMDGLHKIAESQAMTVVAVDIDRTGAVIKMRHK